MAVLRFYIFRIIAFLVPFVVYCLIGLGLVFSTVFATITGVCLSYLFLNKQRQIASRSIADHLVKPKAAKRSAAEFEDNDYEDSAVQRIIDSKSTEKSS